MEIKSCWFEGSGERNADDVNKGARFKMETNNGENLFYLQILFQLTVTQFF